MRRPVFQSIVGVSIAVSAISLGIMLTEYLSLRAYSPGSSKAPVALPPRANASPPTENWKNLFAPSAGMQLPSRLPVSQSGVRPAVRSNFILLGTIVSTRPEDSRAILWSDGMKLPQLTRINTEIEPGAVLASVTRDKAMISRGAIQEQLDLLPVGSKARSVSASDVAEPKKTGARQPPPDTTSADKSFQVERISENSFALDEENLAQLLGNLNQFMTNVRLTPYFEGNTSAGYRIAAIRQGTAFDKLGFRGGDVLQNVNGVTLSSPEKMYSIFQNLKDEKKVSVDIIRQGQKSTLRYEIR